MNRETLVGYAKRLAFGLAAIAVAATPSFAQTYDLCATTGSVTMPDMTSVPIWGYVAGDCTTGSGTATLPGPELRATAGQTLTINLYTDLSVAVSFFAPGLRADGVASTGAAGFFTLEATAGSPAQYVFPNIKAGTYLYHSGTDITTQVPMGLYGALVVDVGPGQAYGDVAYASDEVLIYSEIDPNLNADPANFGGARVINWDPQYFLINGAAYPDTGSINVGTSQDTLLRFVNAGLETVVPTLDGGLYMDLVAEDGNRYPQPFRQYGIELPAGKTIDAIVRPGADGSYALYDRALHLTGGGMLAFILAGAAPGAPTANPDAYTVAEDGLLTADGVAPNPDGVLGNDSDPNLNPLTAVLVTDAANGALVLDADGTFTYAPDADFNGIDTFTYLASNGTLDSNVATVTITVTPVNDAPVAVDDAYDAEEGMTLIVAAPGVLGNDVEVDGEALTASEVGGPTPGLLLNPDGSFEYTPAGTAGAVETFQYEACDPTPLCDTATVTITVKAVNVAPVALDDSYVTDENVPLNVPAPGVLVNDSDANGDPLTAVLMTGPANGSLILNADGSFTYSPNANYNGPDSFTYVANDGLLDSNVATVTITVNSVNSPPIAADDFASTTRNSAGVTFSVTANDIDTDDGIDVATVDLDPLTAGRQTTVTTSRGGTATVDNLGNVTFVPKRGFRGTDTFNYTVQDTVGATSNVATVRVNVL